MPKGSALLKTKKGTEIVGELGENDKANIAGKKKSEDYVYADYEFKDPEKP